MESSSRGLRPRLSFPTRLSVRSLLAIIAVCAIGMGIREAYNPFRLWKRAIRDANSTRRFGAMNQVFNGRNPALDREAAFDELVSALRDPEPAIRSCAAATMTKAGPAAGRALPDLIRATRDRSADVRAQVYNSLSWITTPESPGRAEAIAALARGLADPDRHARSVAASEMLRCGHTEGVLPVALGLLKGGDAAGRTRGVFLLRGMEPLGTEARSALLSAIHRLDDTDPSRQTYYLSRAEYSRFAAAILLARSGGREETLPVLREAAAIAEANDDTSLRLETRVAIDAAGSPPTSP